MFNARKKLKKDCNEILQIVTEWFVIILDTGKRADILKKLVINVNRDNVPRHR